VLTRRQFLAGFAVTIAALSGYPLYNEYKKLDALMNSVPVLLYHRVGSEPDDLTISIKRFKNDLEFLALEGYNTLSFEQLKRHLQDPLLPLPEKSILITFDDGYLDNYSNAFPLLKKYSMKASFYIITGMIGMNDRLSVANIKEMQAAGMDFGSHTVTHRPLAELSMKEVTTELKSSKADLEQIIGKTVEFIAYPCGSYSAETLKLVRQAGYIGGFSVKPGFAMFDNRLTIKRLPIFHFDKPMAHVLMRKGLLPDLVG
jgi:peptidoglycan/xylan/chitin deacetylase (PgdA/CDA1 family)